jgi:hypothetical protein
MVKNAYTVMFGIAISDISTGNVQGSVETQMNLSMDV